MGAYKTNIGQNTVYNKRHWFTPNSKLYIIATYWAYNIFHKLNTFGLKSSDQPFLMDAMTNMMVYAFCLVPGVVLSIN